MWALILPLASWLAAGAADVCRDSDLHWRGILAANPIGATVYNPSTRAFTLADNLGVPKGSIYRMQAVRVTRDGLVYFVHSNGTVDAFNPCTNSTKRMHTDIFYSGARNAFALAAVDDSLLVCGGYVIDGAPVVSDAPRAGSLWTGGCGASCAATTWP